MKFLGTVGKILLIIFALIGIVFTGVFVSMKFGWTNVKGSIAERNSSFFRNPPRAESMNDDNTQAIILCKVHALANYAPETAKRIQTVYETSQNIELVNRMFGTAQMRFQDTGLFSNMADCARVSVPDMTPIVQTAYAWADSDEWQVLKSAFIRDQDVIRKAAADAGVSPRILLGGDYW